MSKMKIITITYTDGDVLVEGPYTERVANQYAPDWKRKKLSKNSGIKSVRVTDAK